MGRRGRGSSPRGRGKPGRGLGDQARGRLIPAWAGKTTPSRWPPPSAWAHPRVGGENVSQSSCRFSAFGSSPRGRGKRAVTSDQLLVGRLIPAWAGKTTATTSTALRPRAHPRVGGENGQPIADLIISIGSSPRGRGKPGCQAGGEAAKRLIPAWAGKTDRRCEPSQQGWAHPRVGGENKESIHVYLFLYGSSPRGRGKLYTL